MSEKPLENRTDSHEDLLDQIITQGLDKLKAPAQAAATEEAPEVQLASASKQKGNGEGAAPVDQKTRRSAVYLYLLVLFGAAFLLLLLAYFVQQRNSEDTISDLRESMNFSRQELLNEIKDLKEQISALEEQNATLVSENAALGDGFTRVYDDLTQLQERFGEREGELADLQLQYDSAQTRLYGWGFFWTLEQYCQMEDYVACARLLLLRAISEDSYPIPDAALWRYNEIVPAVIDAGILGEDYYLHLDDYSELLEGDIAFNFDFKYSQTTNVSRETER